MTFAQQILPAVAAAAQIFQGLGVPFDTVAFLMQMSKNLGITWLDQVVYAPEVQQKSALEYNAIKQATGGDLPIGSNPPPNPSLNPAMLQNGQPGTVGAPQPGQGMQQRQEAQGGAQDAQRVIGSAARQSLRPSPMKPALASSGGL